MKEHIEILRKFQTYPYGVLNNEKECRKLMAAINKSLKVMSAAHSRKKERERRY